MLVAALLLLVTAACGSEARPIGKRERVSLLAAGDIASCWWRADEATARILDRMDGVVAVLGDAVYQSGTESQFEDCYGPTWGRHLDRTRPALATVAVSAPNPFSGNGAGCRCRGPEAAASRSCRTSGCPTTAAKAGTRS